MAGLAVARTLKAAGIRAKVYDKGRSTGGRIATRRTETAQFDHGAQYFTVRAKLFIDVVEECLAAGVVGKWEGRFGLSDGRRTMAARPSGVQYVGTPGMSALPKHLADGLDCTFKSKAESVERYRNRWRIIFEDGSKSGLFDVIVSTCPPKQSAAVLSVSEDLVRRIEQIQMEPCWALMVELDEPAKFAFDGVRVTNGPFNWVARNNSKPGRSERECWVAHTSPDWAAIHSEESSERMIDVLTQPLLDLIGCKAQPAWVMAHRWRYARVGSGLESPGRFLWDEDMDLGAVGDWCTSSRVEDAYMNGVRIAEMLISINEQKATSPKNVSG